MKEALPKFENRITDLFFSCIQSDKILMKKYLDTVAATGDLRAVNSQIAQKLCKHFNLSNTKEKENSNTASNLIQSYSKLKKEETL